MSKAELLARKDVIQTELSDIEARLLRIERMEKPYEAVATGYSGRYSTFWKAEEQARKKLDEYYGKTRFKNGLLYGVILIKHNEDGTTTDLERKSKVSHWK